LAVIKYARGTLFRRKRRRRKKRKLGQKKRKEKKLRRNLYMMKIPSD
jgi:hypothetical protein